MVVGSHTAIWGKSISWTIRTSITAKIREVRQLVRRLLSS
jgi:hypothetical protein